MDEATKEQKYSCGCHVVDGELVAECTQVATHGEISAERHGVAKPFSAKCSRLAAEHDAEVQADADMKAAKAAKAEEKAAKANTAALAEGKFNDEPATDAETRAEEAADEVDDAVAEEAAAAEVKTDVAEPKPAKLKKGSEPQA